MHPMLIDVPEVITTPNLRLQAPKSGYGEKLNQAILDGYQDYVYWLGWPVSPPSIQDSEMECRKHHAEFILRDCIRYLIIEKTTDIIVGRCAFPAYQAQWNIPQFGISYFIRKSHRCKGYATEASCTLTKLAFEILKAKKVEIYCDPENVASNAIPTKLGYTLEYTKKGGWLKSSGELANLNCYSIFYLPNNFSTGPIIW